MYAVTNFWDPEIFPKNIPLEKQQGTILVDAAVEEGVHHFVYRYQVWQPVIFLVHFTMWPKYLEENYMYLTLLERMRLKSTQENNLRNIQTLFLPFSIPDFTRKCMQ